MPFMLVKSKVASSIHESRISKNYVITFTGKHGKTPLVIDNKTHAGTKMYDPESHEEIQFFFAMLTEKGAEGDLKLGKMCLEMDDAGVYHTTYDAKSGTNSRITRLGCSVARLKAYASATSYTMGFDPEAVQKAYEAKSLKLENPNYAQNWYPPYSHLSGPYEESKSHLYRPFESRDKFMIFKMLLTGSSRFKGAAKGCGMDLLSLDSDVDDNKFCQGVFPVHDMAVRDVLEAKWLPLSLPSKLPINDIKDYFGEEIGFYFAFLGHLVSGLMPLFPFAVAAQIASIVLLTQGKFSNMIPEAICAVVGTATFTVIIDKWVCEQSELAHLWECFGCRKELPPRPGFVGEVVKNPTNGKVEIDFPASKRMDRKRKTISLNLGMIVVLIGTVLSIFVYKYSLVKSGASSSILLVPSALNSIQITIFGAIYNSVANWMTNFENHKTIADHNSALFNRLILFYFINYYATLFYIAFIKSSVEDGCADIFNGQHCGRELSIQVGMVFLVNDFGNRIFVSVIQPFMTSRYKAFVIARTPEMGEMGPIEAQFRLLAKYDTASSLVLDYIELFIQWGYLVLFGSACPLVILFAAVTNYVETRTDGYKLLHEFRRVLPNRVDGIGEPLNVFLTTLRLGVVVNAGLLVYTYETFNFLPQEARIWCFIFLVILFSTFVLLLETSYPDVSEKTVVQLARQQAVYSKLILENEADSQQLDFDESMLGKTQSQIKAETPEEKLEMTITEHEESGPELALIVSKIAKDSKKTVILSSIDKGVTSPLLPPSLENNKP